MKETGLNILLKIQHTRPERRRATEHGRSLVQIVADVSLTKMDQPVRVRLKMDWQYIRPVSFNKHISVISYNQTKNRQGSCILFSV